MHFHWQSLTAAGIVTFTLVVFIVRLIRPRQKPGCGKGCGCGKPTNPPRP